jgi:hypothetical protein
MRELLPYPKEIVKHFKNPKNLGRMKNPDAVGEAGNLQEEERRVYELIVEAGGSGKTWISGKVANGDGITAALLKKNGIKVYTEEDFMFSYSNKR